MKANFEEKTFEVYFDIELAKRSNVVFPPGQFQEGFLGFDMGVFSGSRRLWRRLGYPFWFFHPFVGVELKEIADKIEADLNITIRELPRIKCNLLLQYKRPEYIKVSTGKEWTHWNNPYYRYDIEPHQQALLEKLDNNFGSKVLVLYAAPAIHDINDLYSLFTQNKIIDNSNFRKASELANHDVNTYTKAGTYSIACSEPEHLNNFDFLTTISNIESATNDNESNVTLIINFRKQLVTNVSEDTFISDAFNQMVMELDYYTKFPLLYSILTLQCFRAVSGTQWLVSIGEESTSIG